MISLEQANKMFRITQNGIVYWRLEYGEESHDITKMSRVKYFKYVDDDGAITSLNHIAYMLQHQKQLYNGDLVARTAVNNNDFRYSLINDNTIAKSHKLSVRRNQGKRYPGLYKTKAGKWVARIWNSQKKKRLYLGSFDNAEDAYLRYVRTGLGLGMSKEHLGYNENVEFWKTYKLT